MTEHLCEGIIQHSPPGQGGSPPSRWVGGPETQSGDPT
jgi:hypothetical protein